RQGTTGDTIRRAVHAERLTQLPARTQNSGHSHGLPIRRGSPSGSPEPCAQHVHGLQGNSYWISSCLILSRVEASTKPGVIHPDQSARLFRHPLTSLEPL